MANTIKIPSLLHEIHGMRSNYFDIIATHLLALLTVSAIMFLANDLGLHSWKQWVLIALAYDLGAGIMSNFTSSTKKYYEDRKRRIIFLTIHFLQPLFMCWIFPEHTIAIALLSGYTVLSAFVVDAIQHTLKQITLGVILSMTGIIALHVVPIDWNLPLHLLLTFFLVKLPLSFTVRWHGPRVQL